ncbi:MAG: tyrosine--tRNA ligase [Fibrobacterales bacterium]
MLSAKEQLEILKRGVIEIVPEDAFVKKLEKSVETGKPLNIKLGIDPTSPDIHLGFTVVMRKLAKFQELGHQVTLIIGDYTATIGDPSGKNKTRPRISHAEVMELAETYKQQFFKIVDEDKTNVVYNGDWFRELKFDKVAELMSQITVAQMLERQDFQNRYKNGQPISLHEFMYPMMQGYDSVVIKSDVEIGGTDQKFNVLRGRELQAARDEEPQVGLFMPILLGTCGREKMSKSLGNYVGINESPQTMYHKIYNIPDALIENWYELLTDKSIEDIRTMMTGIEDGSVNPNQAKIDLALDIVSQYYGADAAKEAQEAEKKIHSGSAIPDDAPEFQFPAGDMGLLELLLEIKAFTSKGEARRMIQNGGVKFNGEKVTDPGSTVVMVEGMALVIQVGKRKFFKVNH